MVHPIAGTNQYPFTINGIIVDGAKINGQTYVKDLFIYKQRSYNMYDLIDSSGTVYEFIEITWIDDHTKMSLNYFDNSSFSVQFIPDNTFFIKIQDISRNIFGFISLMQLNKVKVHTGDYIYYNQNDDFSLLSVRCIPDRVQVKQGETVTIDVSYIPFDYPNTSGKWTIENITDGIIKEHEYSRNRSATFTCLKPGHAIVSFDPDANKMLTATAHIFVEDDYPVYNSFTLYPRYNGNDYRYISPNDEFFSYLTKFYYPAPDYFVGDELVLSAVFSPNDYTPSSPLEFEYDSTIIEYIGTDDNKEYKFEILKKPDSFTTKITAKDGNVSSYINIPIREPYKGEYIILWGTDRVRPGNQYQYRVSSIYQIADRSTIWSIDGDSSIATIDDNGLCTVHGEGDFTVMCSVNGSTYKNTMKVYSNSNIPDFVYYTPDTRDAYNVGEEIQLEAHFLPESVSVTGMWREAILAEPNDGYYTLSDAGVLKILKAPPNLNQSFTVGYVLDVSKPIAQQLHYHSFSILPEGETITPTSLFVGKGWYLTNIPVGEISRTFVSVGPSNCTVSTKWSYTVDDPSIVKVDKFPKQVITTGDGDDIYFTALKKGTTNVTITVDDYPNLTETFPVTVF